MNFVLTSVFVPFFFFNDTATTEIYTLSLHDALPTWARPRSLPTRPGKASTSPPPANTPTDRKSTRLNSSHVEISYAVFCLKKKKKQYRYRESLSHEPKLNP